MQVMAEDHACRHCTRARAAPKAEQQSEMVCCCYCCCRLSLRSRLLARHAELRQISSRGDALSLPICALAKREESEFSQHRTACCWCWCLVGKGAVVCLLLRRLALLSALPETAQSRPLWGFANWRFLVSFPPVLDTLK